MEEKKEHSSLTIGDILDQLTKPSITQKPEIPTPKPLDQFPKSPSQSINKSAIPPEFKLPQIDKKINSSTPETEKNPSPINQLGKEKRLYIRTMATDLNGLKSRPTPPLSIPAKELSPLKISKDLPSLSKPEPILPPNPNQPKFKEGVNLPSSQPEKKQIPRLQNQFGGGQDEELSKLPSIKLPPIQNKAGFEPEIPILNVPKEVEDKNKNNNTKSNFSLPPLPSINKGEKQHIHEETIISTGDLPAFLGAPLPKKKPKKDEDEKIEYGVLAKIISSGMTTGILGTIAVALAGYFVVYYLFLQPEEITVTPTPSNIVAIPTPEINELENIFQSVELIDFSLSPEQNTSIFKTFIDSQHLNKRQHKRIKINILGQTKTTNLADLFEALSISNPNNIRESLKDNFIVLIYGQDEQFNDRVEVASANKLIFITEISDVDKTMSAMKEWEDTIAESFYYIYDLESSNQATPNFLDNIRDGIVIRYKNFPLPDKSIDYSIASSLSGRHYLIIAGSRESMYFPIDKIRGI